MVKKLEIMNEKLTSALPFSKGIMKKAAKINKMFMISHNRICIISCFKNILDFCAQYCYLVNNVSLHIASSHSDIVSLSYSGYPNCEAYN